MAQKADVADVFGFVLHNLLNLLSAPANRIFGDRRRSRRVCFAPVGGSLSSLQRGKMKPDKDIILYSFQNVNSIYEKDTSFSDFHKSFPLLLYIITKDF